MKNTDSGPKATVFNRIILNRETYQVNDSVSILEKNEEIGFGKILKIWQHHKTSKSYITISWYYTPSEVFSKIPDFISSAELFDSENIQDIEVQCIIDKIFVYSLEEYHSRDEVEENVYFTRASFNYLKKTLDPGLSTWMKVCYCESIVNPDLIYNRCDGCSVYFHFECCEFSDNSNDHWLCKTCTSN